MAISLTSAALQRAKTFISKDPSARALRFSVKKTGCSGWGYVVDVAHQIDADDQVFELDGVKVVVDARSLSVVDGTEIDFRKQGLNATFVFNNPNMAGECGCGESFSVTKSAELH